MTELDEDLEFDPELDGDSHDHGHPIDEDGCGPPVMRDCVDDCLESLIECLVQSGYDDDIADQAVYQALEGLMQEDAITDTPDIDQPETMKLAWIGNAKSQILGRLREMGLEFGEQGP